MQRSFFIDAPCYEDLTKKELIARRKAQESKLAALEGNSQSTIEDHRLHALREISSGISHNLNNLLTGMLLQAELISSASSDPEVLECVQDILRTRRRGADLGLALRENISSVPHPIDLKTAVLQEVENSRAVWEAESNLEGRELQLSVEIDDPLPQVHATASDLNDFVIDLLNAGDSTLPALWDRGQQCSSTSRPDPERFRSPRLISRLGSLI
ncbi:TPA: hypothetical protein DCE37_21010 [Candidatus Latescibacteria bacterium]|nr:hypothetical protein [Candidatus Latescibacterota bacterium]